MPGRIVDRSCTAWDTDSATTITAIEALTVRFQNPWPKAVAKLGTQNLTFEETTGVGVAILEWERGAGVEITQEGCNVEQNAHPCTVYGTYLDTDVSPGNEYVYQVDINTSGTAPALANLSGILGGAPNQPNIYCIWLEAYPL
jgi:hypothetical protein